MTMTTEADKRVAAVALDQMVREGTFYVTKLRTCAELLGVPTRGGVWNRLEALHCMRFLDMPDDIQRAIGGWMNEALSGPPIGVVLMPALREGNVHLLGLEDT